MVIGHEASGVVAKVGKNVTNLVVGDRVAIEPGVPCRLCTFCKEGKYNLCPDMVFCATPPYDGNLTKYFVHKADFCYKLPDHVTMEEGALLEPLSVGVHACRRANVGLSSTVLILGAGPIGLTALLTAKFMGATNIIITDLTAHRLELAKELGATHTLLIEKDADEQENLLRIHKKLGCAPDKTIDCSGAESTARLAILATRSGGCAVLVGMGAPETKLPLVDGLVREVDIRGVFRYCNDYSAALAMISNGQVDLKRLITHHYNITETLQAFETARYGHGGAIKVIIHCTPRNANNPIPI